MEPRHLDGSDPVIETDHIKIVFQHGAPHSEGINGCRVEDVVTVVIDKLMDFQGRALACDENDQAVKHLILARNALLLRRKRREQQGLIGELIQHQED